MKLLLLLLLLSLLVGATRVVVVIPCYNEELRLPKAEILQFAKDHRDEVRLLLVNDGSTDGTLAMLRGLSFDVLDLETNVGKAEAVRLGMLHAIQKYSPQVVGFWDADLATPLSSVLDFVQVMDRRPEVEMVFGARVALLGRKIERHPFRHYLGRVFATMASTMLQLQIYDTQCGAKLFAVNADLNRVLADGFMSRWIFDVELIARVALLRRGRGELVEPIIYEYPLEEWRDVDGSKISFKDKLRALHGLFDIWRVYYSPEWVKRL